MEGSARDLLEYRKETAGKRTKLALVLLSLLALTAVWRITQGEWAIPLARVAELISPLLSGEELSSPEALVVRSVRLPRFLAAAGTGGLLAVSGVVLQGLLANPLAEPYTLGIASGAAFGGGGCHILFCLCHLYLHDKGGRGGRRPCRRGGPRLGPGPR